MAKDKSIVKKHGRVADQIIALEAEYSKLTDEELANNTNEFKNLLNEGTSLDDLILPAFATVREAAKRLLGLNAYRVQLIGALILHDGDIAEMKTGEGKTLTGLFSAYLNALEGKGVHIVTVNEYLSQRDSEINGQVLTMLGLTVGLVKRDMTKDEKRQAYACDITYTTNAEIGFDYLRDNMVFKKSEKVQRGFNYAIIDEADSILIDEARTPLIISGGKQNRANLYKMADEFSKKLVKDIDVEIDLETKQVYPTDSGIKRAHSFFNMENLFDIKNTEIYHLIMNALKANFVFKKEIEYTVQNGEIILIDQFTGRVMPGRSYSDGLQQALQAKEDLEIEEETITLATITYQNFYRLYAKLSGMTGTAKTDEEEFLKIYNTRIVVCPTNKPVIRKDYPDYCFYSKSAKLKKMVNDIKEINKIGRPILIGTTSVESSEQVSRYLDKSNLKYEMINAKNHSREAEIIEKAGQKGAITLATNMAGRGTDIKLTEETRQLGGLIVVGVERNESRRVDNQLRGRAGRQGDPGSSVFYISMEDDLMIRFASPKIRNLFRKLGDDFIQSKLFSKSLTNAQKKLEGLNFDQRKNVLDYDNILSQHRENIYLQRDDVLDSDSFDELIGRLVYTVAYELILKNSESFKGEKSLDKEKYINELNSNYISNDAYKLNIKELQGLEFSQIAEIVQSKIEKQFADINQNVNHEALVEIQRRTILQAFDKYWTKHINLSQKLRSGIYLQQYAQNNPLNQYIEESSLLFKKMKIDIATDVINVLINSRFTSTQDINDIYETSAHNEPKTINLRAEDILEELGLKQNEFNRANVLERFNFLKEKNKSNKEALVEINAKEQAMIALMNKLDQEIIKKGNDIRKEVGIKQEKLDELLGFFEINSQQFTREYATKIINDRLEAVKNQDSKKEIQTAEKKAKEIFDIMDRLDQAIQKQKQQEVNIKITDDDIKKLKKEYNLTKDKYKVKELKEIHMKFLKDVRETSVINKVNRDFGILAPILCPDLTNEIKTMNKKTQSGVFMLDKEGKVKKVVKLNNDGSISDEDMEDTELVSTKVKIG